MARRGVRGLTLSSPATSPEPRAAGGPRLFSDCLGMHRGARRGQYRHTRDRVTRSTKPSRCCLAKKWAVLASIRLPRVRTPPLLSASPARPGRAGAGRGRAADGALPGGRRHHRARAPCSCAYSPSAAKDSRRSRPSKGSPSRRARPASRSASQMDLQPPRNFSSLNAGCSRRKRCWSRSTSSPGSAPTPTTPRPCPSSCCFSMAPGGVEPPHADSKFLQNTCCEAYSVL